MGRAVPLPLNESFAQMRNEELGMKVAASPQSINRAMPEGGIQVTSHQSLVTRGA